MILGIFKFIRGCVEEYYMLMYVCSFEGTLCGTCTSNASSYDDVPLNAYSMYVLYVMCIIILYAYHVCLVPWCELTLMYYTWYINLCIYTFSFIQNVILLLVPTVQNIFQLLLQ